MSTTPSTGLDLRLDPGFVARPAERARLRRDLHFDLGHLGEAHRSGAYTLRIGGRSYPMRRHTDETLRAAGPAVGAPTHFAEGVETDPAQMQLAQVLGPDNAAGLPTLASVAVTTPSGSTSFTVDDIARAIVFLNPAVTVLTPDAADTVLGHIGASTTLPGLSLAISTAGAGWTTTQPVLDDAGAPVLKSDGTPFYTFELAPFVLNSTAPVSGESKAAIYSDTTLQGVRWNRLDGVSHVEVPAQGAASGAVRSLAATGGTGYSVSLQDGGPRFGLSVAVNSLSQDDDGNLVLDLAVTNSYIRHTSVFVSFLKADGVTPMVVPENVWTALARGAMLALIEEWLQIAGDADQPSGLISMLKSDDNTLWWCGNVSSESTFLGVPVSASNTDLTFALPEDQGTVGKIRLLVGSLGVASGNDWDPAAAWLGLSMTALLDLAIPTYSLVTGVGDESSDLVDSIFKDAGFLLPTAYNVMLVGKDIITGSSNTGGDLSSALIALADALVGKVLTSTEVIAKLALYFGGEEAEEAIPLVGWGMKVLALEGTVAQLAQTVGEVIGSPRVVEFDLTVSMTARITLVPVSDDGSAAAFPATATSLSLIAQYSDGTTRTSTQAIADPGIASIEIEWDDVPVGGSVTFVVAMFSPEGWGVGKGQSATVPNLINDDVNGVLAVSVGVQQELYPLDGETSYRHAQLLVYTGDGDGEGYQWEATGDAPTETRASLGSGAKGHVLEDLAGITLSDDLGVLGYSWAASGLGIPPVGDDTPQTELYTMQNLGFVPLPGETAATWPQAGYMTAPAGYAKAPLLLYLRAASTSGSAAGPGTFFLDPSGDAVGGFHLRAVSPVTDPAVPMDDPTRAFDLATGTSWGRFGILPTSMAIHSNGVVVAVNPAADNVQILPLPAQAGDDADAPWAFLPMGPGTGPGRVSQPALVAIAPDQTILVLEKGNGRIQAVSVGGHPVPAFPATDTPYWIPLASHSDDPSSVVYLSMSVDVAGYVFVLSQTGDGSVAEDFWLDVYTPAGGHLFAQQGLVAGGMAVDLWRNLFTLNFQQISGPGGRTEPSVSEYVPSTPASA